MNVRALLIASGILLVSIAAVLLGVQLYERNASFRGSEIDPPPPAFAFELERGDGSVYRLADQGGKVVLVFFGYTNCPDFCPATLAEYRRIYEDLDEDDLADQVEFVFITIDPERDDLETIETYVTSFNSDFVGLGGAEAALQPVWDGYFVFREKQDVDSEAGYLMAHSTRVYVIDPAGRLRLTFPFGMEAGDMARDVRKLLDE